MAYLNKGLKIELKDERKEKGKNLVFKFEGGIKEFVQDLNKSRGKIKNKDSGVVLDEPLYYQSKKNDINVECSYSGMTHITKMCYASLIISLKKMEELIY